MGDNEFDPEFDEETEEDELESAGMHIDGEDDEVSNDEEM